MKDNTPNVRDVAKAVLRGKFVDLNTYRRK